MSFYSHEKILKQITHFSELCFLSQSHDHEHVCLLWCGTKPIIWTFLCRRLSLRLFIDMTLEELFSRKGTFMSVGIQTTLLDVMLYWCYIWFPYVNGLIRSVHICVVIQGEGGKMRTVQIFDWNFEVWQKQIE